MKELIFPVRVVIAEGTDNTQNLLIKQPLQIGLSERKTTVFEKDGYVVLDFGMQMCGGVRILTFLSDMAGVRIRLGESLTECCSELGGTQNSTNDHALRDITAQLPMFSDMTFGNSGFRFVRLDFSERVVLKCVVAVNHILSKKTVYRYNGTDRQIEAIYQTAKRTVDLCASSGYVWDGIKRDRLVWIGDMHPETLALTTLYGPCTEIERSLDFVRQQTPLPGWMNDYPMYSMWWVVILGDYYKRTDKKAFIKRQLSYLNKLVEQMLGCVKEDGELDYPSYFVDWPTSGKPDMLHGVRAINIMAAKSAIEVLQAFGKDAARAELLLTRLLKREIAPEQSKQVIALKHFAIGQLSPHEKQILTHGGAKGMSAFMGYYILKAVASFDRAAAIRMMKEYYGAMLDKGATTFFEHFDMDWVENSCRIDEFPKDGEKDIHGDFGDYCYQGFRHSLCHGWSAGVLSFIKEECEEEKR